MIVFAIFDLGAGVAYLSLIARTFGCTFGFGATIIVGTGTKDLRVAFGFGFTYSSSVTSSAIAVFRLLGLETGG